MCVVLAVSVAFCVLVLHMFLRNLCETGHLCISRKKCIVFYVRTKITVHICGSLLKTIMPYPEGQGPEEGLLAWRLNEHKDFFLLNLAAVQPSPRASHRLVLTL